MITSFCTSIEGDEDDLDEEAAEVFFEILGDIEQPFFDAITEEDCEEASEAFAKVLMAFSAIINSLLGKVSDVARLSRFDILAGIASELYRSLV